MKNKNTQSNLFISKFTKLALVLVLALFSFFGGATLVSQSATTAKLQNSSDPDQTVHAAQHVSTDDDIINAIVSDPNSTIVLDTDIVIDTVVTIPAGSSLDLNLHRLDITTNGVLNLLGGLYIGNTTSVRLINGGVLNIYGDAVNTYGDIYVYDDSNLNIATDSIRISTGVSLCGGRMTFSDYNGAALPRFSIRLYAVYPPSATPGTANYPVIRFATDVKPRSPLPVTMYTPLLAQNSITSCVVCEFDSSVSSSASDDLSDWINLTSEGYPLKNSKTSYTDYDGNTGYRWEVEADYLVANYYSHNDNQSTVGDKCISIDGSVLGDGYSPTLRELTRKEYLYRTSASTIFSDPEGSYVSLSALSADDIFDLSSLSEHSTATYTWPATRGIKTVNIYTYDTYTGNFYSTTESSAYDTKYYVYNRNHSMPSDPIRSDFEFAGWSIDKNASAEWTSGTRKDTSDRNFYAVWNGSVISGSGSTSASAYGSTITATYYFGDSSEEYTAYRETYNTYDTGYFDQNHSFDLSVHSGTSSTRNTGNHYRLINNGSTGNWQTTEPTLQLTHGFYTKASSGYTFKGWSDDGANTSAEWTSGARTITSSADYYAVWYGSLVTGSGSTGATTYGDTITATYHTGSGSAVSAKTAYRQKYSNYTTGYFDQNHNYNFTSHSGTETNSTTATYYKLVNNGTEGSWSTTIPDLKLTHGYYSSSWSGYTFVGWSDNGNDSYAEWTSTARTITSSANYYAVWSNTAGTRNVSQTLNHTFYATNATTSSSTATTTKTTPYTGVTTYYKYDGTGARTLNEGGTAGDPTYTTLSTPITFGATNYSNRSGYSFKGWSTDGNNAVAEWTTGTQSPTTDSSYYGVWTGSVTATTNNDSATTSYGNTITATYHTGSGSAVSAKTAYRQTYYKYNTGYYNQNHNCDLTKHSGTISNSSATATYYRLVNNGTEGSWSTTIPDLKLTHGYYSSTWSGYTFVGWSDNGADNVAEWTKDARTITSSADYYAVWSNTAGTRNVVETLNHTFYATDATTSSSTATTTKTTPYTGVTMYYKYDGTGARTLDSGGTAGDPTYTTLSTPITFGATTYSGRSGYSFKGWSTDGNNAVAEWTTGTQSPTTDSSYYGVWTGSVTATTNNDSATTSYGNTITATYHTGSGSAVSAKTAYRQTYYKYNTGYYNQNHNCDLTKHSGTISNSSATATYYRLVNNGNVGNWSTAIPDLKLTHGYYSSTWSGYTLAGWSDNGADNVAEWTKDARTITSSADYYAVWSNTAGTRSVSQTLNHKFYKTSSSDYVEKTTTKTTPYTGVTMYYKYDGTGARTLDSGGTAGDPTYTNLAFESATRTGGYSHVGWTQTSTGASASWTSATSTRKPTSSENWYAVWSATITWTFNYNANGHGTAPSATSGSATQTYNYDITSNGGAKSISVTTAAFISVSGYTQTGWSTSDSSQAGSYPAASTAYSVSSATTGSTTLYAIWSINTYKLTATNGYWVANPDSTITVTATAADGSTVTLSTGSTTTTNGTITVAKGATFTVSHTYSSTTITVTETRTNSRTHTIWAYDGSHQGTNSHSGTWTPTANGTWNYYVREHYSVAASGSTGVSSATVTAYDSTWDRNVTSNAASGVAYYGNKITYTGSASAGYTWQGWYTAANGGGTRLTTSTSYVVNSLITDYSYYAYATANSYNITVNSNSGTGGSANPATYSTSTSAQSSALTRPTYGGHHFRSWSVAWTDSTHSGTLPTESSNTLSIPANCYGNLTIKANWYTDLSDPAQSGSLTYNGGSQSPSWTSAYDSTKMTLGGTTSGIDATSYTASFTPKDGYCWSNGSTSAKNVSWSIGAKGLTVSWTSTSFTYSGAEQKPAASVSTGVTGETIGFSYTVTAKSGSSLTNGKSVNVGNYHIVASAAVSGGRARLANYSLSPLEKDFSINNATLSGSVTISGTATYGNTLTANVTNTNSASLTYQWYMSTTSATSGGTAISGATGDTYVIGQGLVEKYIYVVVSASKANYSSTTWANKTAAVGKRAYTVSATANSKTYDGSVLTLTYTTSGTLATAHTYNSGATTYTDTITVSTLSTSSADAGSYTVTPTVVIKHNGTAVTTSDYAVTVNSATGTINAKALSISAYSATWTGETTYARNGYGTGVGTETLNLTYTPNSTNVGTYTYATTTGTGKYLLAKANGTGKASNYTISSAGTFTITAKAITSITLSPTSYTYNGANQGVPTATVKSGETALTKTTHYELSGNGTSQHKDVGTYTITATGTGNYTGTVSATWKINQYTGAITVTLSPTSYTYNGSAQGVPTVTVKIGSTALPESDYTLSGTGTTQQTDVGSYRVTATGKGGNLGTGVTAYADWSIVTLGIAIPTSPAHKIYNGASQAHGITYETGAEIVTASSTTSAIDAGTYNVVFKVDGNHKWNDGTATNKTVSWVIDPKSLTVSWSSTSLVYNGAGQHPTASVTTGVTEETIGFTYTVTAKTGSSLTSGEAKNVGSYSVAIATSTVSGGRAKIANYSLSPLNTDFEITKKKATITLSSYAGTIKYDSSLSITITYDGDGTVNATSANTTYVLVANTNASMNVGVIAYKSATKVNVTVSATAGSNYSAPDNVTYEVTLKQRDLTITAKPQTITYGSSISQGVNQVELSGDGLASGDTLAAITLTASDTNATTTGTITPSAARIEKSGANVTSYYNISYVAGVLKIDKHAASITLDPTSATIIYGNNTSVSITYVGDGTLTASSNASSYASVALANNKQSMTITAAAWRADTVTITVSATAGANYLATSASFVVTLEKRAITITGGSASKVYDGTPLTKNSATLTSGTLASGDTATYSATGSITDVGTANNIPNVVIKKSNTDVTSYYSITKVNGTLEITAKTLTITADNKSVVYGNALPAYTYSVSGLASGDTTAVITTEPKLTCGYALYGNVGEYNIVPSGAVATNYTISYVNGKLTVTQREVTITWSTPTTWVFDNNTHSVSATAGNRVSSDEISFTYTGTTSAKNVGNYTATISGLSGTKKGNYKLPASGLSQAWSITRLGIAIPSNPAHLTYNGASQNHNVSIPTGASVYATGSTQSATDAGTYDLILQVDGNHKWNDDSITNKTINWTIDPKSVAVVWTNGTPYTYSGAHQAPTAAINSGVTGETIVLTITLKNSGNTTVAQTIEVGSYTANASIASVTGGREKAANYTLTDKVAAYVIQKSTSSLVVTNGSMYVLATLNLGTLVTAHDGALTYTIKSQTTTGSAISTATLTAGTLSAANDNNGSVVVTVNDAGDANHSAASKDLTVTVSKYSVTITLTADASIAYGATGKTISAATATTPAGAAAGVTVGAVTYAVTTGNSLTVNSTTGALTTAGIGTSTITASAARTTTVKAGSATKNIEVVKAGLTVTVNKNVSIKYGNSDNVTVTVKSSVTNAAVAGLTVTASGAETYVIKSVSDYTISNLGYKITPSAQTVTVSVAGGTYYNNQTTTYTVSVAKRAITITSANDSKVYNGSALTNHEYTITGDGLASYKATGDASAVTDVITLSWTGTATNVADTANNNNTFSVSTLKHASTDVLANYEITKVYGKLTITAASLTIKADNKSTNYGQAVPTWSYTATGFVNGETTAVLGGSASYTIKNGSTTITPATNTPAGTYTIKVSGIKAANYTITFTDGTWTVGKSAGTLTLEGVEVTYDSASHSITVSSSGGTVTYSTTENGTYSGTNPSYIDVGTYTVWAKLTGDANHSDVAPKSATVKINAKSISVTWGSTTSWTYDGNNHAPTVTTPVDGAGSEKVNLTVSGEQKNVGSYTATASIDSVTGGQAKASNYTLTNTTKAFSITAAGLTIKADNKSVVYGDALPTYTYTVTGLIGSDTLTTNPTVSCSYERYGNVGSFDITASGAVAANYTITYQKGTLTVSQREVSITWPGTTTWTYDGETHTVNAGTPGNLVNSDAITFTYSGTTSAKNVGNYTATISGLSGTKASNYKLPASGLSQAWSITAKAITVTADDKNMTYGGSQPTFTYTATGLINGDTLSGTPAYKVDDTAIASVAFATLAAGSHTIGVSGLSNDNYSITFNNGTLTVNKAALTVTAVDKNTTYGDAVPTWTYTATGFVNDETTAVLGGTASYTIKNGSTPITPATNTAVGSYTITVSGLTAANYTITFTDGTWTVGKKALTIKADNQETNYGEAVPTWTYTATGFVNDETTAVLGGTASYTIKDGDTTITPASTTPVGTYTIYVSGLTSNNYAITFNTGDWVVNAATLTEITLSPTSYTYNGAAQGVPTATVKSGSTTLALTTHYTLSGNGTSEKTNVGTYTITATGVGNYSGTVSATWTINQYTGELTVVLTPSSYTYTGSPQGAPDVVVKIGDNTLPLADYNLSGTGTTAQTNAGTYTVTARGNNTNLGTAATGSANWVINPAELTSITLSPTSYTYNGVAQGVPSETVKFNTTVLTVTTDYILSGTGTTTQTNVGTYRITATGTGNFTGSVYADWTINKYTGALTVVLTPDSYTYTGSPQGAPSVVVKIGDNTLPTTDYTLSGDITAKTNADTYTITATGSDTNLGTAATGSANWVINAAELTSITLSPTSYTYNGAAQGVPTATVKSGETTLTLTTHYTLSGNGTSEKTNVGTYTITATGAGNYSGTVSADWTINQYTGAITVVLTPASYTYNGEPQGTPDVVVKIGNNVLPSADYNLSGTGTTAQTNAGTYRVTATGKGGNLATSVTNYADWVINAAKLATPSGLVWQTLGTAKWNASAAVTGITTTYQVVLYKGNSAVETYNSISALVKDCTTEIRENETGTYYFTVRAMSSNTTNCENSDVSAKVSTGLAASKVTISKQTGIATATIAGASSYVIIQNETGVALVATTSNGYSFASWSASPSLLTIASASSASTTTSYTVGTASDITLTVTATLDTFSIVFNKNANDATGTMSNLTVTYNTPITLTANGFSRTSHTFRGWATTTTGAVAYQDEATLNASAVNAIYDIVGKNGNYNIYAVWHFDSLITINSIYYSDSTTVCDACAMGFVKIQNASYSYTFMLNRGETYTISDLPIGTYTVVPFASINHTATSKVENISGTTISITVANSNADVEITITKTGTANFYASTSAPLAQQNSQGAQLVEEIEYVENNEAYDYNSEVQDVIESTEYRQELDILSLSAEYIETPAYEEYVMAEKLLPNKKEFVSSKEVLYTMLEDKRQFLS